MKKRIVFIEPAGAPSNVFAKFMTIPLLGPVYLGTIAKQAGYPVIILNENILKRHVTEEELLEADVLCVSCITATFNRGREIARQYRTIRKNNNLKSKTLIGGIHASMLPLETREDFDQVICGEAETEFLDVLNGKNMDTVIKGRRIENLDSIPIPDFSIVKNSSRIHVWPVMTSRGCPHDCNFCSVTQMFGKGFRTQSTERVLDEIFNYKRNWIFFVDDNFSAIPSRTHKLLDQMLKYRFKRNWTAQVRVDAAHDPKLVTKMYNAGCRIVFIGFESINPGSLKEMRKNQEINDITNAINIFHKAGIQVHGMFMLGNDPDSSQIFKATSKFSKKQHLDFVQYSILTPLPGTEVFHNFVKSGRLLHKNWSLYDGLHVVFKPKQMSPAELQKGMIYCFSSFYSYIHAVKNFMYALFFSLLHSFKHFYPYLNPQSFYPVLMKIIGKSIIRNWLKTNKPYLDYLQKLSDVAAYNLKGINIKNTKTDK